jgi:hypothetical protein
MSRDGRSNGVSLAKGPAGIIGIVLLAFGVTALIFGSHSFTAHAVDGTVNGKSWLGFEVNGWSSLLCAGTGLALLLAAPLHWGAKTIALVVGLIMGAASVIALVDGDDVFGIFAANGLTKLGWGVAAAVLLVVALLPRVGREKDDSATRPRRRERTAEARFTRDTAGSVNESRRDPALDEARTRTRGGSVSADDR